MAMYDTVANIVSQVAVQCGLGEVSDVFASTDPNIVRMRGLLTTAGRRLVLKHPWLQTIKEHTFTTTVATSYSLPADFLSMVDQSGWNRTSRNELRAASSQEWQYLKATQTGVTFTTIFKPGDLTLQLWPQPPTAGETIAFEYRSRYWVRATASSAPDKDAPTVNTDVLHLEAELVKAALKLEWLGDMGFPVDKALSDLKSVLFDTQSVNKNAAPVLSLNCGTIRERLLDESNAPSSGLGFDGVGGLY